MTLNIHTTLSTSDLKLADVDNAAIAVAQSCAGREDRDAHIEAFLDFIDDHVATDEQADLAARAAQVIEAELAAADQAMSDQLRFGDLAAAFGFSLDGDGRDRHGFLAAA